jgi:hypothetical protein
MMNLVDAGDYDTERRLGTKRAIERLRRFEPILDGGRNRPPRVALYLRKHQLHTAEERRLPVDGTRGPLFDAMRGHYAIWTELGYETGAILDEPGPDPRHELVVFPYLYDTRDVGAVQAVLAAGTRVILELPTRDLELSHDVASAFGLEALAHEFPGLHHPVSGWNVRTPGAPDAIAGYAYDSRVLLAAGDGYETVLHYGDNAAPAAVLPRAFGDRLLVLTFPLGCGYERMRHWGVRHFLGAYAGGFLEPDLRMSGVPKELSSFVEARLLESDEGALVFVVNRSRYDQELELAVAGYETERVSVPSHTVAHVPLQTAG